MVSAAEIRRQLLRKAGIETAKDAQTGIVALVAPDPALVIVKEIEKEEWSNHWLVRIIRDQKLGFVSKAYQSPPNTRSLSLITPDPEGAVALLEGFVNYARVEVPLDWGTLEQQIARAQEQVAEWRREAQRNLSNNLYRHVVEVAAPKPDHSTEYSEYPPSPSRRRPKPYLHLLGGPLTVQ